MVTQKRCKVSLIQKTDETQTHGTMISMFLLFLSSVIHVVLKFLKQTKLKIASALGTKNNMLYLLWRVFKRVWVFLHLLLSGPFYSFSFIEFFSDFIVLFSIFHLWFSVFSRLRLFICLLIRVFCFITGKRTAPPFSVCLTGNAKGNRDTAYFTRRYFQWCVFCFRVWYTNLRVDWWTDLSSAETHEKHTVNPPTVRHQLKIACATFHRIGDWCWCCCCRCRCMLCRSIFRSVWRRHIVPMTFPIPIRTAQTLVFSLTYSPTVHRTLSIHRHVVHADLHCLPSVFHFDILSSRL